MRTLFIHLADFNLAHPERESALFQKWLAGSFFEVALDSIAKTSRVDQSLLVCPAFACRKVLQNLEHWIGHNPQARQPEVIRIPENSPFGFGSGTTRFNPMRMDTRDSFGAWTSGGLEMLLQNRPVSQALIWNMESFWFLASEQIDALMQQILMEEFIITGHLPDDLLVGLEPSRRTPEMSAARLHRRRRLEQLRDNYNTLIEGSSPAIARKVQKRRNEQMTDLQESPLYLKSLPFFKKEPSIELLQLVRKLRYEATGLSLRRHFGRTCHERIQALLEKTEDCDQVEALREAIIQSCPPAPQVLQVQLQAGKHSRLSLDALRNTLKIYQTVPCWILQAGPMPLPEVCQYIEELHRWNIPYVILESSAAVRDTAQTQALFDAGLSTWVLEVDAFLRDLEGADKQGRFHDTVAVLDEACRSFPVRTLLLKIENQPGDIDLIPQMMQRWYGIVDGIVILPAKNPEQVFRAKTGGRACTIVPYELSLRVDGRIALCTELPQPGLESGRPGDWVQAWNDAGNLEACQTCTKRQRYAPRPAMQLPPLLASSNHVQSLLIDYKLQAADQRVAAGLLESALDCLEAILKIDPVNQRVWERIDHIESQVSIPPGSGS